MEWIAQKVKGDFYLWLIVFFLSLASILVVYSSTGTLAYKIQSGNTEFYLIKQFLFLAFGLLFMYFAHLIDYRVYSKIAVMLVIISIPLLIYTLFFGTNINEANRWISLPIINVTFQTSDLAKLGLIMYVSRMLSKKQQNIKSFKEAFVPIMIPILIICGLIAPANLSTSMVLFSTCLILMFIGRVNMKYIFLMIAGGLIVLSMIIGIAMVTENSRFGTWKNRIKDYTNNAEESYQVQQAKIAISTGGVIGKGPGKSTQRNYLPHPYSDFIYAIIIEEYGIVGGIFVVFLYVAFLFRSIRLFIKSPGAFGALLAVGLSFSLVIQAMINMAVTVNLLPVTGLTLPLISMGGSSIWFTSFSIGIILSVSKNVEELMEEQNKSNAKVNA